MRVSLQEYATALADSVLPASFNQRLSPEYDAEQEAGGDPGSDLLSASQKRAAEDGRR